MSGGGGQQSVTQNSDPWSAAQPYLKDVMGRAQYLSRANPMTYYPGNTYVGPSMATNQGMASLMDGSNNATQVLNAGNQALMSAAGGGLTSPYMDTFSRTAASNPALGASGFGQLQDTLDGKYLNGSPQLDALYGSMSERALDQIGARYEAAGRSFSGLEADRAATALGDIGNQIYADNYARERANQLGAANTLGQQYMQGLGMQLGAASAGQGALNEGLGRQLQAAGIAPSLASAGGIPGQMQLQAGQLGEGYTQDAINDAMSRYYGQQNAPWQTLERYNSIVQGFGGLGSQSSGTMPSNQPSMGQKLLGGGLGGLGTYAALAMNPITAPFALAGGLGTFGLSLF